MSPLYQSFHVENRNFWFVLFLIIHFNEILALVTTFNLEIGITGAILTKLDGDSRGGAALSVKEVGSYYHMTYLSVF